MREIPRDCCRHGFRGQTRDSKKLKNERERLKEIKREREREKKKGEGE